MSELKYHWSNPKFDGLPWPADSKSPMRKKRRRRCVKLNRSKADARQEAARLNREETGARWSFKFCLTCQGFHVIRH